MDAVKKKQLLMQVVGKNGPEEVSGERAGRWDYEMQCNVCQFMGLTPLSLLLIGLYAE